MEFGVLGPLRVRQGGRSLQLGSGAQRKVLAVLLARGGGLVTVDELTDALWPDIQVKHPVKNIQTYVYRLRQSLGDQRRIAMISGCYAVVLEPGELDSECFAQLVERAQAVQRAGDLAEAADRFEQALGLWRGRAYSGLEDCPTVSLDAERLAELRMQAVEGHAEACLGLGRHRELTSTLSATVAENPFRERLTALLMHALHGAGRRGEALEAYERIRRQLDEDLGVQPGSALRELHAAILSGVAVPEPAVEPAVPPAQLPRAPACLSGRQAELAELLGLGESASDIVVVASIDGMAGVGKTALAVTVAHQLAGRFPDGQLFIDLHGFTPGMAAVDPMAALERLLRAVGVPATRIPNDLEDRAAQWRSWLSHNRVLVVLDNAADERQVRPLLPGSPGCLVLMTSRRRLDDLDDIHPVSLDLLPTPDAVHLFVAVAGADRLAESPADVEAIVELCGRLPLAIRLLATRLRKRPTRTIAEFVEGLRDNRRRLAELGAGERSVANAFEVSYQQHDVEQRRMFRLLGLHPGADFDAAAAARLAGIEGWEAEHVLEELVDGRLLESRRAGRYAFHDLLRDHAEETTNREDAESEREAALERLLVHYLETATGAARWHEDAGASTADRGRAVRWLDAERANLVVLAGFAKDRHPAYAIELSRVLRNYLGRGWYLADAVALHGYALHAARVCSDRHAEATALSYLGGTYRHAREHAEALTCLRTALAAFEELDDQIGQATALTNLGDVLSFTGRLPEASDALHRAVELHRDFGDARGEARALRPLSNLSRLLGRYDDAEAYARRMISLAGQICDQVAENNGYVSLAAACRGLGRSEEAVRHLETGLQLARQADYRMGEHVARLGLGNVLRDLGRYGESIDQCRHCLALAEELHDRNGQFEARRALGETYQAAGRSAEALDQLHRAVDLAVALDQPHDEARARDVLGHAYADLAELTEARKHWQRALAIFRELGVPEADSMQARLARLL